MNSTSLASNALGTSALNHALRSQPSVPTGVGDVSGVDDSDQLQGAHTHNNHVSHNSHSNHPQSNHHMHLPHHHNAQYGSINQIVPLQENFGKINDNIVKLENDVATLSQELGYFRHVVDFQNSKIDKLTSLLTDILQNKDTSSIVNSLQSLQEGDPFNVNDNHDSVDDSMPESVHDSVHDVHDAVHDSVHDSVHDVTSGLPALQSSNVVSVPGGLDVSGVSLNNNMDPQLHQVAQAAVSAQGKGGKRKRSYAKTNGNSEVLKASQQAHQQQTQQQRQLSQSSLQQQQEQNQQHQSQQRAQSVISQRQQQAQQSQQQQQQQQQLQQQQQSQQVQQAQQSRQSSQDNGKNSLVSMPGLEVVSVDEMGGRKKPKIAVNFLHNPMTVKDIYDEFTIGFRGQIPLREMDERFGKHEWRGDSRSKESKRFQRRKKLCDAIERGMAKYGKTAEEVIRFIEDFRGEKSLTWVMNGNLPRDLLE